MWSSIPVIGDGQLQKVVFVGGIFAWTKCYGKTTLVDMIRDGKRKRLAVMKPMANSGVILMDLPEKVVAGIRELAEAYDVQRVVLFGSRARGDNHPKSDVDLAVYGCADFTNFSLDVDEKVWTLLMFDILDMDSYDYSQELLQEIARDGVTIYEKV